jgi:hypothetical protein
MRRGVMSGVVIVAWCVVLAPLGCGVVRHGHASRQRSAVEVMSDSSVVTRLVQSGAESVTIGTEGSREFVDEEVWRWEAVYDTLRGERGAVVREVVSVSRRATERLSESSEQREERRVLSLDDREVVLRVVDVEKSDAEVIGVDKKRVMPLAVVFVLFVMLMLAVAYINIRR